MDFFRGRKAVIATRHRKEKIIAPILEDELGLICVIPNDLDTDRLGTFSGEVEREDDPVTTLRKKCQLAIGASGIDLVIPNEGSFGTHPSIFFAQAAIKLVKKAKSLCPSCGTPGFGIVDAVKGLPCEMCGLSTGSTLKHIYGCQKCTFKIEKEFPFEKHVEDPQYCDFCNP